MLSACLWGLSGLFSRRVFEQGTNVFTLTLVGEVIVILLLLIFCNKKINFKISKLDLKRMFFLSVAGVTALVMVTASFKYTKIANAEFLHYTMPVFVLILAVWLLKEHLNFYKIILFLVSILGMGMIFIEQLDFKTSLFGNSLALLSAIFYALAVILTRKVKHLGAYTITFWHMVFNLIFLLGPAIIFFSGVNATSLFYILLYGIIVCFMALVFYFKGLVVTEASIASIVLLFEVVAASAVAWLFLGESLTWLSILGGLLILGSSAWLFLRMKKV